MKKTFINKLHFSFVFLALITLTTSIVLNFTFNTTFAANDNNTIKIIVTSDLHGKFTSNPDSTQFNRKIGTELKNSNMSHKSSLDLGTDVKNYIDAQRKVYGKDNVIVVDLGDTFTARSREVMKGDKYENLDYRKIEDYLYSKESIDKIIPIMNAIGYNYYVPGNHEGIRYLADNMTEESTKENLMESYYKWNSNPQPSQTDNPLNDITFNDAKYVTNDARAEKFFLPASILYNIFNDQYKDDHNLLNNSTKILSANMQLLDQNNVTTTKNWLEGSSLFRRPLLTSNLSKKQEMVDAFKRTYTTSSNFINNHVKKYDIVEAGNLKVGLIGLTTKEILSLYNSNGVQNLNLDFNEDILRNINELINMRNTKKIDYIVALTHIDTTGKNSGKGKTTLGELSELKLLDKFDFIINGHKHGDGTTSTYKNVTYVQASEELKSVVELTITKDTKSQDYNAVKFVRTETASTKPTDKSINSRPYTVEIYKKNEDNKYHLNATYIADSKKNKQITLQELINNTVTAIQKMPNNYTLDHLTIDKIEYNNNDITTSDSKLITDKTFNILPNGSSVVQLYYRNTDDTPPPDEPQYELKLNVYYENPLTKNDYNVDAEEYAFTSNMENITFGASDEITAENIANCNYGIKVNIKDGYAIDVNNEYAKHHPQHKSVTFDDEKPKTMNIYCYWKDVTVSFDPGLEGTDSSGEHQDQILPRNAKITLPECKFTPLDNYVFSGWKSNSGTVYPAKTSYTLSERNHTTFTAVWEQTGGGDSGGGDSGGGDSGGGDSGGGGYSGGGYSGGGYSGGGDSSGGSSYSSSTTTSNATNTAPTTNVPVAITYEFKADRNEAIDVFAVYKDYINQSFNTANITDKNNKAIVFKTNNVTADGKKDNLAIWTFELKTLDNNFAQIYKERIDLEQKVNAGTASEAEKANLDSVKKQLNEYNFKLSVSTSKFDEKNTVPEKIAPLFKGKDALLVDFTQNGKFPGQAIVDLNLGKEYANKEFYVYYLHTDANSKKSTIQLIGENVKVAANGYVRFRSNHGANYIFTPKGKLPNSNAAKQLADQAKNAL